MQHFLFVLLKRPLNASREKRHINTRILLPFGPERERERASLLRLESELLSAGAGADEVRGWVPGTHPALPTDREVLVSFCLCKPGDSLHV